MLRSLGPDSGPRILDLAGGDGGDAVRHYGIRTVCDQLTDEARKYEPAYYADLERRELALTARHPYPHTARLFQLTARKGQG
ncbi:hypothetical protein [Streptomyces koyangensis]|uniref:hypothetical protein n=1 Tax=Streptomyces koyangensis TaxID=188770 RepID=UPI00216B35A7|nr:hypothetical protein [Streptomyces koyangensis]WTD06230.1 hypothetical protein OH717_28455 [Streptomyces albidoflavus]